MTTREDPLVQSMHPTARGADATRRVHYATGMLLDVEDFRVEQHYHRGRLARALCYLHGCGTVAGLRVVCEEHGPEQEKRLMVEPGLAIDRIGRLIEAPRPACIRLERWYEAQEVDDLQQGFHEGEQGVVVDLFLHFVACEHGYTPAFAAGPYEALDAVAPSRLTDGYRLELVIRSEGRLPVPVEDPWQIITPPVDAADQRTIFCDAILDAWRENPDDWDKDGPTPIGYPPGVDPTGLVLARIIIPALEVGSGERPIWKEGEDVVIDNHSRLFALTPGKVALLLAESEVKDG